MTSDPLERLERHGRQDAPDVDKGFADQLESKLRVEHSQLVGDGRRRVAAFLPRLGLAAAFIVAGVIGVIAFADSDRGVPVSVIDDDPIAPVDQPRTGDDGDQPVLSAEPEPGRGGDDAVVADSPTVTATPLVANEGAPVPTAPADPEPALENPTVVPSAVPATAVPTPILTPEPQPSTTAIAEPTPTVVVATAVVVPTRIATAVPRPSATSTPESTATPEPTATATPAPPEPAPIDLTCEARIAGDEVGAVCQWTTPVTDVVVTRYEIWRSLNGSEAEIVARQRAAAPATYIDRSLNPGDTATYLVRGLDVNGQVVSASIREVVVAPLPE